MSEKLKRTNAVLGLLTIILLFIHTGFNVFCYMTMFYDPVLKNVFSLPLIVVFCLHAVLGISLVFMSSDGTSPVLYPGYNKYTIAQRISAALLFPVLLIHLRTFAYMSTCAEAGIASVIVLLIMVEILFFGTVFTHISVSFSRALITLGLLSSREKQRRIDKAMITICAVFFVVSVIAVVRTQLILFMGQL